MFKRVTIVALVVAAFLVLAVPALAFNGMRENYSVATSCQGCHTNGNFGAPKVFDAWAETKHAENEAYAEVKDRVPTGSVCQGCHTANFDPAKMTPTPTATTTAYSTPVGPTSTPTATTTALAYTTDVSGSQTGVNSHNGAWSENYIGCSSCHYGAEPISDADGRDVTDTAHRAPFGEMANADICGTCHSRYSYTVATYTITPIPTPECRRHDPAADGSRLRRLSRAVPRRAERFRRLEPGRSAEHRPQHPDSRDGRRLRRPPMPAAIRRRT